VGGRQVEFFRSDCQDARFGRSGPCFVAAISSGIPRRTTSNLAIALPIAHRAFVLDNSGQRSRLVFSHEQGNTSVWQKYSYGGDVARGLARMSSDSAWATLLGITRESIAKGQPSEELLLSLGSMLTRDRLGPFFELLRSDGLEGWRPHFTMGPDAVAKKVAAAVEDDVAAQRWLARLCIDTASFAADALGLSALAAEESDKAAFLDLATAAMDAGRLVPPNSPTYHILLELFTRGSTLERNGQRYHSPTAHGELRQAIFDRAAGDGANADACRRLLADIESARIEMGRPTNELRHPRPSLPRPWTEVLFGPARPS
jgi:hypothetical protein